MRSLLVLVTLAGTAYAGNNELSYSASTRALRTSSANTITDSSLDGGGLTYARRLGAGFIPHVELWAHGAFAWGGVEGTMFQTLSTELSTLGLTAGAQARYALHRLVAANARVELGATRAQLSIRDEMDHSASGHGWGATAAAVVGLDIYALRGARFALALRVELGAVATSSIPLTATPDSDSEGTLTLEMTAASLGSLNLSGPVFALGAVGHF